MGAPWVMSPRFRISITLIDISLVRTSKNGDDVPKRMLHVLHLLIQVDQLRLPVLLHFVTVPEYEASVVLRVDHKAYHEHTVVFL